MAKGGLKLPVKRQASSNGRHGDVFALRLTSEERARLQKAADAARPGWKTGPAQLGPWILACALRAAVVALGATASTSTGATAARRRRMPGRGARS